MAALERVVRSAYELGALSATDAGAAVYTGRGWLPWSGPTSALTPDGLRRTPEDDGTVHVLPVAVPLDRTAALACDWRDGDLW
jgi:aminoglycoside 2'-N-acetyltransferase I